MADVDLPAGVTAPTLHHTVWGDGPPVLFVHGLGASSRYWDTLRQGGGGYRGIAPDLLGFGRSPRSSTGRYDVDDHLDALAPLVEAGTVVVGHSTGAILAAALAARSPDRVRGLLLIGLPAFPDADTARTEVGRLGLLARLTAAGSPVARILCEAMCRLRPLAIAAAPLAIRDLPPSIASDGARHSWPSYSRTLEHVVIGHRVAPDLVAAGVAVRLLHGASDTTAPVAYVRSLAAAIGAARLDVRLDEVDGDHHLAVRRPDTVAAALGRLLAAR